MKFQYKVVFVGDADGIESALNKLGAQGWELVGVTTAFEGTTTRLYLKRPAPVKVTTKT